MVDGQGNGGERLGKSMLRGNRVRVRGRAELGRVLGK